MGFGGVVGRPSSLLALGAVGVNPSYRVLRSRPESVTSPQPFETKLGKQGRWRTH